MRVTLYMLFKKNVFEDKRITLKELRDALEANFGYSDAAAPIVLHLFLKLL